MNIKTRIELIELVLKEQYEYLNKLKERIEELEKTKKWISDQLKKSSATFAPK